VHGMNKEELIAAIKEIKGISDDSAKAAKTVNVRELKEKINSLRQSKIDAVAADASRSKINILRKRINRLKKRMRRAA
jgi:polyhydroxyalkanoate synthesis regulator phasin